MISYLKNNDGFIYAFITWQIVDRKGQFENRGEYIYIEDLYIAESNRGCGALNKLIGMIDIHPFSVNAKWIYWQREKYNERISHLINRFKIAKKGDKYGWKKTEQSAACAIA